MLYYAQYIQVKSGGQSTLCGTPTLTIKESLMKYRFHLINVECTAGRDTLDLDLAIEFYFNVDFYACVHYMKLYSLDLIQFLTFL